MDNHRVHNRILIQCYGCINYRTLGRKTVVGRWPLRFRIPFRAGSAFGIFLTKRREYWLRFPEADIERNFAIDEKYIHFNKKPYQNISPSCLGIYMICLTGSNGKRFENEWVACLFEKTKWRWTYVAFVTTVYQTNQTACGIVQNNQSFHFPIMFLFLFTACNNILTWSYTGSELVH